VSTTALPRIASTIVGAEAGPARHEIDTRWLMAYAGALGETDDRYYDTLAPGGPCAHPVFPVCYEWPVLLALRERTIDAGLATRSVHTTHHLILHRPPRAGDTLHTAAQVIAVLKRRSGTLVLARLTTIDDRGAPVTTTEYGAVYRGIACDADATLDATPRGAWTTRRGQHAGEAPADIRGTAWERRVDVPAWAAHVYTEGARIWNPIHTDRAVARTAGLPGIILHGTATLAVGVSRVVAHALAGDPARVHEVAGRFTGMVPMPSSLTVRGHTDGAVTTFTIDDATGARVLDEGVVRAS
jgi:acyl dehydratase